MFAFGLNYIQTVTVIAGLGPDCDWSEGSRFSLGEWEGKIEIRSQTQLSYVTYAALVLFNIYVKLLWVEIPENI